MWLIIDRNSSGKQSDRKSVLILGVRKIQSSKFQDIDMDENKDTLNLISQRVKE